VTTVSTPTIDLGTLASGNPEDEEPQPARTSSHLRRYWRDRARRRMVALSAVSMLLIALPTAAATSAPRLDPLFTVPAGDAALLDDGRLYVLRGASGDRPDDTLTAYRLSDGAVLWEAVDTDNPGYDFAVLQVRGGVPLLTRVLPPESGGVPALGGPPAFVAVTTAYDPSAGAMRWSHEGWVGPTGDGNLVILLEPSGSEHPWDRMRPTAIDLGTGEVIWTAPAATRWTYGSPADDAGYLVTMDEDGQLTTYDVDTGTKLGTRTLPTEVAGADPYDLSLQAADDLVILQDRSAQTLHAYDVASLAHRWTVQVPSTAVLNDGCGPVLCLLVLEDNDLHGIDPDTGESHWSVDLAAEDRAPSWPRAFGPIPDTLLAGDRIRDAATGEQLLALDGWEDRTGGLSQASVHQQDPVLVWRERRGADTGPRIWFGQLRSQPLPVEVLGYTAGWFDGCDATTRHLACRGEGDLYVWHIRWWVR
jgi:outer membrane protein assembly factor BamB